MQIPLGPQHKCIGTRLVQLKQLEVQCDDVNQCFLVNEPQLHKLLELINTDQQWLSTYGGDGEVESRGKQVQSLLLAALLFTA